MKDIRDMRRSDWHRILERNYTVRPCSFRDMEGVVSLLQIQKVTNPLTVPYEGGEVLIADAGYSWLQVAFKNQFVWATVMFDKKGDFLQAYFDITGGNMFEDTDNPKFTDMYLDLVLTSDGKILVLDEEELTEALENKEISGEQYAKTVAEGEKLYGFLKENSGEFLVFCKEWREKLLEEAKGYECLETF